MEGGQEEKTEVNGFQKRRRICETQPWESKRRLMGPREFILLRGRRKQADRGSVLSLHSAVSGQSRVERMCAASSPTVM